jgi:hypothetical protein
MTSASVITNIQAAWAGIMESTMNALWKMHPQCTDSSGEFGKPAVEQSVQEDETELLALQGQPSSKGFKDSQSDDTMELMNSHEEVMPEENLVEQKTINTLVLNIEDKPVPVNCQQFLTLGNNAFLQNLDAD